MTTDPQVANEDVDAALALVVGRSRDARALRAGAATLLDVARAIYRGRRKRDEALGQLGAFGEPAWDIILDLYIAMGESRRVSISSACIAAAVPHTTALRWLAVLEKNGTVLRTSDRLDGRVSWVTLTDQAYDAVTQYLQSLASG